MTGRRRNKFHIGERMPDGSIYSGISPETGEALYTTAADAPLTMTFFEAKKYAQKLQAHGYNDWRLPTKDELRLLFNRRASIGGFKRNGKEPGSWYWSSSFDSYGWLAWAQHFVDGQTNHSLKDIRSSVRCVR